MIIVIMVLEVLGIILLYKTINNAPFLLLVGQASRIAP